MELPAHPTLAPGAVVLHRDAAWLEVRLGPHRAVVLPDRDDVRSVLAALREHRRPAAGPSRWVLERLTAHDLVVDARLLAEPDAALGRGLAARAGLGAAERLDRRRAARILLRAAEPLAGVAVHARAALERAALGVGAARLDASSSGPVLLLTTTEEAAEQAAECLAAGTDHLVVLVDADACTVGPYVRPGLTACLHCVAAHHTDRDPRWPITAARAVHLRGRPTPPDPALVHEALALAAADLCRAVEGDVPHHWSSSRRLTFDGAEEPAEPVRWLRHPACGCAWDRLDAVG